MASPVDHIATAAASLSTSYRGTPLAGAPTTELGTSVRVASAWGAILEQPDRNRDFRFPLSVRNTVPGMLDDAQCEGLYRGLTYPIVADYKWWLDPNGAPQTAVDRISADYNLPVGPDTQIDQRRAARRFIFDEHVEDALRATANGLYPFEKIYEILQDGPSDLNGGWVAHLRKLAPRPPRTLLDVKPAPDGGLEYIRVPSLHPEVTGSVMGVATPGGVRLTIDRLVMYVWDREGANWLGRSMLRSLYRPWFYKDQIVRVGAINIKRAGGVPYVEAGPNTTGPQLAELHQLASTFRVGESAGAALPHGAVLKFAQAAGGDEAINFVRLQNEEMAVAWLQMFRQLGNTRNGSRALGEVLGEDAASVERRVADWLCNVFNRHVIEDDVELNEGPGTEYAPMLRYTAASNPVDALAGALDNAQTEGALPADSQAAAIARAAAGERQPSRPRRRQAARASTAPSPAELSQTDFEDLQHQFETALAALGAAWTVQRRKVIDDLVAKAQAATTPAELATLAADVPDAAWLSGPLATVLEHGAQSVRAEATAQGHTLAEADMAAAQTTVDSAALGTATMLTRSLEISAASKAVQLAGLDPDTRAQQVRDHLEGLAGANADYELRGLVTKAQNEGRFTQMEHTPDDTRFYASELNDVNTCGPCSEEDETEFDSLDEARGDYPAGFALCEGGDQCRGTVVMVLPEATPSA